MPVNLFHNDLVAAFGWSKDPVDTCWLDCSQQGYLKRHWEKNGDVREIVLCTQHAVILEAGVFMEDYSGAPLPPSSTAGAWPWRKEGEVDLEQRPVQGAGGEGAAGGDTLRGGEDAAGDRQASG